MQTKEPPLPWWLLIIPALLVLLYGALSWIVWIEPTWFHSAMKTTEQGFLLFSWAGKNAALVIALLLATIARQSLPLIIILVALIVTQLNDIFAGVRTDVTTNLSYIGLTLVMIELFLLWLITQERNKKE